MHVNMTETSVVTSRDMRELPFIPETQPFDPEGNFLNIVLNCRKQKNHCEHISVPELTIDKLPEKWRKKQVLHDLKTVAKRVVRLTVVKSSPSRSPRDSLGGHSGSGFVTFDPVYGAVINTSKHVVWDPFEAEHTIVTLFYDDTTRNLEIFEAEAKINELLCAAQSSKIEPKTMIVNKRLSTLNLKPENLERIFMYRGSRDKFRSVMKIDYTAFLCKDLPVHELFSEEEIENSNAAFSWLKFSWKRFILSPEQDIDIAVISHPHGGPKIVTFGKMNNLPGHSVGTSLYTAATCTGSSGAPVIRLHSDSINYISAGQFIHHGCWKKQLVMGVGTFRPPITLPYWHKFDSDTALANTISILYEPIIYWTLIPCDFLRIESTLHSLSDVLAYTSSFSALLLTVDSLWFKTLFIGFWLQILFSTLLTAYRSNLRFSLCYTLNLLVSISMFPVAWCLLLILPWSIPNMMLVVLVWLIVLFLERYLDLKERVWQKTRRLC